MRHKIRACEATFSPSTQMWPKITPAIQPNTFYLHLLSFNEETTPPHILWYNRGFHGLTQAVCQWRTADGGDTLSVSREGTQAMGFDGATAAFYMAEPQFSAKTWVCGIGNSWAFCFLSFFRVIRVKVTHVLWGCGSVFYFCSSVPSFFFPLNVLESLWNKLA